MPRAALARASATYLIPPQADAWKPPTPVACGVWGYFSPHQLVGKLRARLRDLQGCVRRWGRSATHTAAEARSRTTAHTAEAQHRTCIGARMRQCARAWKQECVPRGTRWNTRIGARLLWGTRVWKQECVRRTLSGTHMSGCARVRAHACVCRNACTFRSSRPRVGTRKPAGVHAGMRHACAR